MSAFQGWAQQPTIVFSEIERAPCEPGYSIKVECHVETGYDPSSFTNIFHDDLLVMRNCDINPSLDPDKYNVSRCGVGDSSGLFHLNVLHTTNNDTGDWRCEHLILSAESFVDTGNLCLG